VSSTSRIGCWWVRQGAHGRRRVGSEIVHRGHGAGPKALGVLIKIAP
jgi:hypothetical protein